MGLSFTNLIGKLSNLRKIGQVVLGANQMLEKTVGNAN